jgi:alkylhydroperoxidase family enzyme
VLRPELRSHLRGAARVPVAEPIAPDLREALGRASGGLPLPRVIGTLAHSPVVAKRVAVLLAGLLVKTRLPAREREIAILRVGWRCGCLYEFAGHVPIATGTGLSEREIAQLTDDDAAERLAPGDAALVRCVDELYDGNAVSDATWQALAGRWTQEELVELIATVGAYWMVANLLNAFRVPAEEGWPGWPSGAPPTGTS